MEKVRFNPKLNLNAKVKLIDENPIHRSRKSLSVDFNVSIPRLPHPPNRCASFNPVNHGSDKRKHPHHGGSPMLRTLEIKNAQVFFIRNIVPRRDYW
ncbi:MAG: hypothetical protein LBT76_05895 [Tannerella sp.]|jgi:hypothetical protein|nr:hypothetical protein [Tannerella sp.]